jgi:hypothetical protein
MIASMPDGLKPKVFISHSASGEVATAYFVDCLRCRLREWGVDPWLDRDRLAPGQEWNDELRRAIARCDAAILVVTERYLRSGAHYARDEALLFAQRAATEGFDDFRLLVLIAPGVNTAQLGTDPDWVNLEISRRQLIKLPSLQPVDVGVLAQPIAALLDRYRSGTVPLVLREHYADQIGRQGSAAVLAQASAELDLQLTDNDVTPRRFVNALLSATPELRRPLAILERCLRPWRRVLADEVRESLSWDAVAFSWLEDDTALRISEVTHRLGEPDRKLLALTSHEENTMRLHLRRVREYVSPFDDTGAPPGQTTREGLIRAICVEIKARRARRERRDPLTVPAEELDALARDLDARVHATNPLVVVLDRDLCFPDLLEGLPELFGHVILVALATEDQAQDLGAIAVVIRPQNEDEVLDQLEAVLS